MFDLGWTELLLVGVVALIVVGPKDLPRMFRALGKATAKIRGMAREFQRAMEDAADESGMKDVGKDLRNLTNPGKLGMDSVRDAVGDLGKWTPDSKPKAVNSETAKLSAERAEAARKIRESAAAKATARIDAEARALEEMDDPAPARDERPVVDPDAPKGDA